MRLLRYLPLALVTTFLVVLAPAIAVAYLAPRGGPLRAGSAVLAAVLGSVVVQSLAAALWKRRRSSRDIVFADLMLWAWLRRYRTERHVRELRDPVESASEGGSTVAVQVLVNLAIRLERRDPYTSGHSQRVARHAVRTARAMGLPPSQVAAIRTAALVHDVGKLYTRRDVLNNPGRLSDEEFEEIKRHPVDGAAMLARVGDPEITAMVRHHHERLDGRGYPDSLAGGEIPLGARIIAVADTFDAVTSSRAYRRAATQQKGLEILTAAAGTQLDEAAVDAFLRSYSSRRSALWGAFAIEAPWSLLSGLQTATAGVGLSAGAVSLLPALGAAGAFALPPAAPGHHHPNRTAHGAAAHAAHRAPAPARRLSGQPKLAPHLHVPARRGPAVRRGQETVSSRRPERPATSVSTGVAPATHTPATTGLPPTHVSVPPTLPVETPSIPTPPPVPPPTVTNPPPAVPTVTVPTVTVPTVTVPTVTVPGVPVPGANVPG